MPGKFAALEVAEEQSDRARLIGSANTLVRTEHGWRADNTDTEGVRGALQELIGLRPVSQALIIGAVAAGQGDNPVLDAQGVQRIAVVGGLGLPALVRGDHEEHHGGRPHPGEHVAKELFVAGDIDKGHVRTGRQRRPHKA